MGRSALLDYLASRTDFPVIRVNGVQSEMELPFAGVHQLCSPLLSGLSRLPGPQRAALDTAFGISGGPAPDRFLIGLGVLGLLSVAAEQQPLMCLVDDEQWLDRASAQVLAFVARRLGAESVGLVFATRTVSDDLRDLPNLVVTGLRAPEALELLNTVLTAPVDARVRDQIVAETHGNPLALLELPRELTSAELAGGFGLPGATSLSSSIEESFSRRLRGLSAGASTFLLLAASDPSGDPVLVWRAAAALGIEHDVAISVLRTELVELGARVRFRHPLVRSAVYRAASATERENVHRALADATDPRLDPDRRAWHRAQAAAGPDEDVAAELERSAGRARARGGLAAAAAFLRRATALTPDPALRAGRALAAAETQIQAGALDAALESLVLAEAGSLDDRQCAQSDLVRAQLAFVTKRGNDAPPLLLNAAKRLAAVDAGLSRATYLDALSAAIFAGRLAAVGGDVLAVARAAATAPPAVESAASDLLLDGTVAAYTRSYATGVPLLRDALAQFGLGMSAEQQLRWFWLAGTSALRLWDDESWNTLSAQHVRIAREVGSLSELPLALTLRAYLLLFTGDLAGAAALTDEAEAVEDATGTMLAPYGALGVAAFRGDEQAMSELYTTAVADMTRRGEGVGITFADWARAVLHNGLGRYDDALAAARNAAAYSADPGSLIWPSVELVEAAVRTGCRDLADDTYSRFAEMAVASGSDWALGLQLRCRALLTDGETADRCYRESIGHLGRTRMRVDLARAHLLYGESLRQEGRVGEAREQLRSAHSLFETMGMTAFAERARRELRAAGVSVRKRRDARKYEELTAQEAQIARMAGDGLSNPEIATRLFISAHTVQYHLRKVFAKLDLKSRSQLAPAVRRDDPA